MSKMRETLKIGTLKKRLLNKMEKIKLQLLQIDPMKNKIIKMGKYKIDIKPYISSENIVLITDLCLKKWLQMGQ